MDWGRKKNTQLKLARRKREDTTHNDCDLERSRGWKCHNVPTVNPSWETVTVLFVLLGFRLFRCAGLLLLGDWWELRQVLLISFAFVELFGFLVKFIQVEFPDYVFLVEFWQGGKVSKCNGTPARILMCGAQTNLSEAPGHSSTFLIHLRTTHHLFPSLEQH